MDPARKVLAGILPGNAERLYQAMGRLEDEHFRKSEDRFLWHSLVQYHDLTSKVITLETLTHALQRQGVALTKSVLFEELYRELAAEDVPEDVFVYSIDALRDVRAEQLTGEAITEAFEILERGKEVDGQELRGHSHAREFLYSNLGRVDRITGMDDAPEGDIRTEKEDIKTEYLERKNKGTQIGIKTGVDYIDRTTLGFQNGELVLIAGYTGEGKSQLSAQTAWNAAVMQGKNVFFVTTETSRTTTRRRILARHTRLPKFGYPQGLDSAALKNGALTEEQESVWLAAIDDLSSNPDYGKLHISQVPRGATLDFIEARVKRQHARWDVDLIVIDYLALLHSERRRYESREELVDIVKGAKLLAMTFDSGRGVPVVSPWQMSQSSYDKARERGTYTLANLGDTVESERSADIILSLYRYSEAEPVVRAQFLKNRDGSTPGPESLETDFRSTYIGDPMNALQVDNYLSDL